MRLFSLLLAVTLFTLGCNPCEQTQTVCKQCGPAGGCLDDKRVDVCVSDSCESNEDCGEQAFCDNGTCAAVLCD